MTKPSNNITAAQAFISEVKGCDYGVILADPPWRFANRTGKVAPEHKRLNRYDTFSVEEIKYIPVAKVAADQSHLYLRVERPDSGRLGGHEGVGVYLQNQHRLA